MIINDATVNLVKRWEGFKPKAYRCPAGKWTIGYGITADAGIGVVPQPGMAVTQEEADRHLRLALEKFAAQIRPAITAPVTANEFGAFLSLAYNIGPGAFRRSSALRHFNAGDKARAAEAIKLWNKATVNGRKTTLQGLVNRRADEVRLFLMPAAPTYELGRIEDEPPAPTGWAAFVAAVLRLFRRD
jgi:lysozyme